MATVVLFANRMPPSRAAGEVNIVFCRVSKLSYSAIPFVIIGNERVLLFVSLIYKVCNSIRGEPAHEVKMSQEATAIMLPFGAIG